MMNLTKYALSNRAFVKFLMAILVLGGMFSFYRMSKMEDPEITVMQAIVVTTYPGASAHEVELEVTEPLERAIRTMGQVKAIESKSMADVSQITVSLEQTVKPADIEQHWDMLRRKVGDAVAQLPSRASRPVVMDDFGDVYGMFLAMTADGYTETEIADYATMVQRQLQDIEGVGRVAIYGLRTPTVDIQMSQARIASLGILPSEILLAVSGDNKSVYGGYFGSGDQRLRMDVAGKYFSLEDIGNTIITGHEGEKLRLRDIATVQPGFAEPIRTEMSYDGRRAVGISISMEKGHDITKVGQDVAAEIETLDLPLGIDLHKVFYQPDRVGDAMSQFVLNLALSIVIVIVVLMFTMGWRSGVIIGVGLLITVLGTVMVLNMLDGTLQRVSLGAFIIAMGMLVDNAIVVVDGILVDSERGMKRPELLTATATKTAMPLLGATLIAILAFLPIFLSPDTAGVYVRDLFVVLAVSLLLSWLLALVQVPIQADRFLKLKPQTEELSDKRHVKLFRRLLTTILTHKSVTLGIVVVLLGASLWGFSFIQQGFFPNMVYDQLYIEYRVDQSKTTTSVKRDLAQIEQYLLSSDKIRHVTSSIGATPSRYNLVRTISEQGLNYGELIVDFTSPEDLEASIPTIQQYLTTQYPEAYVRVKRYNLMYMNYPIEVMFRGNDPAVLKSLADSVRQIMQQCPATTLVTDNWAERTPSLLINYDATQAAQAGLSRSDVGMSLLAATDGIPVGTYFEGRHAMPILFKTVEYNGTQSEGLDNIPVWGTIPNLGVIDKQAVRDLVTGVKDPGEIISEIASTVPLRQLTEGVSMNWEEPIVRRYNTQRAIKAQCNTAAGYTAEQVRTMLLPRIEQISLPAGYSMRWMGEYDASTSSKKYLFANLPLAVVLMVLILIALFKDYKKPLIIILCLPLSFIGIVAAMLLCGKEFGFVAIVGALGLIGMMIKNGVVLIDEITILINQGIEPFKALIEASMLRFRPVMMASFTTILGMIPLVTDDMFGSMAVTIMGGLFIGTIITLVMIPLFYALFFHIKADNNNAK